MPESFGAQLRRYRTSAGLSLADLSRQINYSKSYLTKIENDQKRPNFNVARMCDAVLNAGGALSALVRQSDIEADADEPSDHEVWIMTLDEGGDFRFHQLERRQVLARADAMLGFAVTRGSRPAIDQQVTTSMFALFDQLRKLGMLTSPVGVLVSLVAHVHTLRTLAIDTPQPAQSQLRLLAARVAEYAGWMSQEAGDDRAALWWTHRAATFTGHAPGIASYTLIRRAELAMYRHDAISTIDLSRQAQLDADTSPCVLGLAARGEALGHALAGDLSSFEKALDWAADLLTMAGEPRGEPLTPSRVADQIALTHGWALCDLAPPTEPVVAPIADQIALTRGWALCDLGRPAEAAEVLDQQVAAIPATARRTRARFGVRRALAHAYNGELDQACTVLGEILEDVERVDSATVRVDLRQLTRTLARWRTHTAVRDLYPELIQALNASPTAMELGLD